MMAKPDPGRMLSAAQAALACDPPMTPTDWRSRVARGTAPPPDKILSAPETPKNRSVTRWGELTISAFNAIRRPPGRAVAGTLDGYTVVALPVDDQPFAVVRKLNGQIIARRKSKAVATADAVRLARRDALANSA